MPVFPPICPCLLLEFIDRNINDNGLGEPENTTAGPLRKHVGLVISFPVSSLHPSSCTPMHSYLVPNVYKTAHRPQMNPSELIHHLTLPITLQLPHRY